MLTRSPVCRSMLTTIMVSVRRPQRFGPASPPRSAMFHRPGASGGVVGTVVGGMVVVVVVVAGATVTDAVVVGAVVVGAVGRDAEVGQWTRSGDLHVSRTGEHGVEQRVLAHGDEREDGAGEQRGHADGHHEEGPRDAGSAASDASGPRGERRVGGGHVTEQRPGQAGDAQRAERAGIDRPVDERGTIVLRRPDQAGDEGHGREREQGRRPPAALDRLTGPGHEGRGDGAAESSGDGPAASPSRARRPARSAHPWAPLSCGDPEDPTEGSAPWRRQA